MFKEVKITLRSNYLHVDNTFTTLLYRYYALWQCISEL